MAGHEFAFDAFQSISGRNGNSLANHITIVLSRIRMRERLELFPRHWAQVPDMNIFVNVESFDPPCVTSDEDKLEGVARRGGRLCF